jgi:hypothetical protein
MLRNDPYWQHLSRQERNFLRCFWIVWGSLYGSAALLIGGSVLWLVAKR